MNTTDIAPHITGYIARNIDTTGYDINVTLDSTDRYGEAGTITVAHAGQVFYKIYARDIVGRTIFAMSAIREHQAAA